VTVEMRRSVDSTIGSRLPAGAPTDGPPDTL
jgi:hypothetical protein